jgi:catechol 2,3-dioxygenase-like lactoylglutathione lyase family enzyme
MTTDQGTAVRGMDCVCYLAKDLGRARHFYEDVLGMIPATRGGSWVEYEFVDGSTFALSTLPGGDWYQTGGAMFAVRSSVCVQLVQTCTGTRLKRRFAPWSGATI